MVLIIQNQTSGSLSYQSGAVTIPANSSYTAVITNIFLLAVDSQLTADCANSAVSLSDGVNTYWVDDAKTYLKLLLSSLSGQVVGYLGSNSPLFAIQVGAKDPNGKIQPGMLGVNNGLLVSGDLASGTTDSGNPIKIGGVYNSSLPTPASTQRVDLQTNQFGELAIQFRNKFRNLTGNATTVVKSGSGRLHSIIVNRNWTGGTIVLYDNTAGSGTVIMNLDVGTPSGGLLSTSGVLGPVNLGPLGIEFSTGLTAVSSGSTSNNFTIVYV